MEDLQYVHTILWINTIVSCDQFKPIRIGQRKLSGELLRLIVRNGPANQNTAFS